MNRSLFLMLVVISALVVHTNVSAADQPKKGIKVSESTLPELPYAYDALEPVIDAKTMEIHYTKHHKGYLNNLLAAVKGTPAADMDLMTLFSQISKQPVAIRNNAGGYYNHILYWESMSPKKTNPSAELAAAIDKSFGSMEKFKDEYLTAAKKVFGSGWAWLAVDKDGKLFVSTTPNQDNPLMDVVEKKGTPLLALDVWEHAYYLKYQNLRADYVDNWWKVINWEKVSERYAKK
jgi:Fe-Mn family superoxide dismutase